MRRALACMLGLAACGPAKPSAFFDKMDADPDWCPTEFDAEAAYALAYVVCNKRAECDRDYDLKECITSSEPSVYTFNGCSLRECIAWHRQVAGECPNEEIPQGCLDWNIGGQTECLDRAPVISEVEVREYLYERPVGVFVQYVGLIVRIQDPDSDYNVVSFWFDSLPDGHVDGQAEETPYQTYPNPSDFVFCPYQSLASYVIDFRVPDDLPAETDVEFAIRSVDSTGNHSGGGAYKYVVVRTPPAYE